MTKPKPQPAEPADSLEAKICEAATAAGLTQDEAAGFEAAPVGAWGDGAFLAKFMDFVKLLLPVLLPLIVKKPAPPTP